MLDGRGLPDSAGHAAATAAGGAIGMVLCADLGPLAAMTCGNLGATLGGRLYDHFFPKPAQPPSTTSFQAPNIFVGGQGNGVIYTIQFTTQYPTNPNGVGYLVFAYGPITNIQLVKFPDH